MTRVLPLGTINLGLSRIKNSSSKKFYSVIRLLQKGFHLEISNFPGGRKFLDTGTHLTLVDHLLLVTPYYFLNLLSGELIWPLAKMGRPRMSTSYGDLTSVRTVMIK